MSAELPIEINMEVEESEMSFDMEVDSDINVTSVQGTDVTDTTAIEADVKSGKVFHKADGTRAIGTAFVPTLVDDGSIYSLRQSTYNANLMRLKKIIGGTIAWNQLCDVSKAENTVTRNGVTFTKMGDGSYRLNGTATANTSFTFYAAFPLVAGRKYYVGGYVKLGNNTGYISFAEIKVDQGNGGIYVPSSTVNYNARIDVRSGDSFSNTLMYPMISDLTSAFGSTIADYVYNIETTNAGYGVAWLKALEPFAAFRPYDAGSLLSVKTSTHRMVGFNQFDGICESGYIDITTGDNVEHDSRYRSKNHIRALPNTTYYYKASSAQAIGAVRPRIYYYDANKGYISSEPISKPSGLFVTPSDCCYIRFFVNQTLSTYNHDICVNFSNPLRNGEYEPYTQISYELSGEELRGFLKLDSQNKLYYDGDEYTPDGQIRRIYGIRAYQSGDATDGSTMITDGTNTVYKLATPTTESSIPYIELQATFPNGTEEFVDNRTVKMPVHQESIYYVND